MKSVKKIHNKMFVFGKIVCKYKIEQDLIDDINKKYEDALKKTNVLTSHGSNLAGRLDSELDVLPILKSCEAFKKITQCMSDYVNTCIELGVAKPGPHNLHIKSCWVNDMKPGEYQPIHTHNDNIGFAGNLYLKVPKFINDVKEQHKFRDGLITFVVMGQQRDFMPKPGDFYIFQADHLHCVHPFKAKNNAIRRSMPLNFIINQSVEGEIIE